jgi:hypothetical protein
MASTIKFGSISLSPSFLLASHRHRRSSLGRSRVPYPSSEILLFPQVSMASLQGCGLILVRGERSAERDTCFLAQSSPVQL